MPFLKQQVELINEMLRASALNDKRFQAGNYKALAVDVSIKEDEKFTRSFPAVMDNNFEAQPISVDDTFPIIIYHKILGKANFQPPGSAQFGEGNNTRGELADMKMVVYGKYAALRLTHDELEALITMNFPTNIHQSKISGWKLDAMKVDWKSSNLNSLQVFNEEYRGVEPFLGPEDILFSVRYTIESKYRKGCFTISDCQGSTT